jgi:hypothetical protein
MKAFTIMLLFVGQAEAFCSPKMTRGSPIRSHLSKTTTMDRRNYLSSLVASFVGFLSVPPAILAAEQNNRPKAPMGALLPATQQRLLLEKAITLATKLVASTEPTEQEQYVEALKSIVMDPSSTASTSRRPKDQQIISQYPPDKILSGDLIRAAMNIYTANLRFGEGYDVNNAEWKKAYIRAFDGLPDVKIVITADLDLRDLYRNEIQLKLEDAQAELYLSSDSREDAELKALLEQAMEALLQWFGMIGEADVQEAQQAAREGQRLQIYDPYFAGFFPP